MITILFNEYGYFIEGPELRVVQKCSAKQNDIHHLYLVLTKALSEVLDINDDIIIYNNSRVIDEINGVIKPDISELLICFRQDILPKIKGVVFFRKKDISQKILSEQSILVKQILPNVQKTKKRSSILNLKKGWFNDRSKNGH